VTEGLDAGLLLFPPGGAPPQRVTSPDPAREERWHRFPHFLPDGRTFLYLAESRRPEWSAIYLARLGQPGRQRLVDTPYKAEFVPPDQLLFVKNGRLVSRRFDLATATLTGPAVDLATPIFTSTTGEAWFSSSPAGVLASAAPPPPSPRDLTWFADDGRRLGTLVLPATCVNLALSPDDARAALECRESETSAPDIWMASVADGTTTRVTSNPANDESPVWSPDGRTLAYARHRAIRGEADVYTMDAKAPADGRPLLAADGPGEHPSSWSPHGDVLLVEQEGNVGKQDIWLLPLAPVAVARPWLATAHSEHRAVISPDGRWVAFESDRTGRPEVYVRSLAHPAADEWSISTRGGRGPRWQRGGRALYFVSEDWQMTKADPGPSGWSDVTTRVLFELPGRTQPPGMPPAFDVTRDGRRFLVGPPPMAGQDPPVTVVVNWRPGT
jgi:dipeptidyl aminopeptidase/acylaminoacyl peptidase